MQLMAFWGPLIYAGCWAATLSTALTNLLSVPRLIQALGIDRIYPCLLFFAKSYGKHGEPYRGYVLTFLVSFSFLLIADLDTIAPLITNFYLASYALINFCTFHAAFIHHHTWRPSFKYYNTWLSLAGFWLCGIIMFVISWLMALITVVLFGTLYLVVLYRRPVTSWGSSTDAYRYREMVTSILTMSNLPEHSKSYNPQLLVLAGKPMARTALLDVGHLITKIGSFMVVAEITNKLRSNSVISQRKQKVNDWMNQRKYRSFYVLVQSDFESAVRILIQSVGLGRMAPNILLIGYKSDWGKCPHKDLATYVRVLRHTFEQQLAVCILRMPLVQEPPMSTARITMDSLEVQAHTRVLAIMHSSSDFQLGNEDSEEDIYELSNERLSAIQDFMKQNVTLSQRNDSLQTISTFIPPTLYRSSLFKPFDLNPTSTLDAWWLYDDGGLAILLPYIIANRGLKEKMPLRIFSLARPHLKVEAAKKCMEELLAMFRIEYSQLEMITTLGKQPAEESWDFFNTLLLNFRDVENKECLITDEELNTKRDKTSRHLRLHELLLEYSKEAGLIVMSLPVPRQGAVSGALYMAWLEAMSHGLPPVLFVRGNDVSVLNM